MVGLCILIEVNVNRLNGKVPAILLVFILSFPVSANDVCYQAADKMNSVIEEWYELVESFGARDQNTSVISMYSDFKEGKLKDNFAEHCIENFVVHEEIFVCFSGTRTGIGAAMCKHPDTNKSGWSYW